jgi:hypothetical protein
MEMKFYITQETKQEIEAKIDVLEDKFLSISDSFTAMENQGKIYMLKEYAHQAIIYDKDNNEVCRIVYSKDKPLSCGAKVYIQTDNRVELIKD